MKSNTKTVLIRDLVILAFIIVVLWVGHEVISRGEVEMPAVSSVH